MLSGAVVIQRVQSVTGRVAQIVEPFGRIDHSEPCKGPLRNIRRQASAALAESDFLGFRIGEGADHGGISPQDDNPI